MQNLFFVIRIVPLKASYSSFINSVYHFLEVLPSSLPYFFLTVVSNSSKFLCVFVLFVFRVGDFPQMLDDPWLSVLERSAKKVV